MCRLEAKRAASASAHKTNSLYNGTVTDASPVAGLPAHKANIEDAKPVSAGAQSAKELDVENGAAVVCAKEVKPSGEAATPTQPRPAHAEDADDWDHQDAGSLDPQAFMRNLAEQGGQDGVDDADGPPPDDEDYHRTVQQVRSDRFVACFRCDARRRSSARSSYMCLQLQACVALWRYETA